MEPRRFAACVFVALALVLESHAAAPYGLTARAPIGPFLNNQMPPTRPGTGSGDYAVFDAFPNLTFEDPTYILAEPNTNRLYVSGRQGTIHWFTNNPNVTTKTMFLDIRTRTQGFEDCGLLAFAFHPQWRQPGSTNRGYVYVWYQFTTNRVFPPPGSDRPPSYQNTWMRLSRFTVPDGSLVANPASELVLINQFDRHLWHNGGGMFFGPDGFLYLTVGDEGGIEDEFQQTQKLNGGLFSGVLRIDVDSNPTRSHPIRRQPQSPPGGGVSFTANYGIPNDNPWLDPGGGILEEFFAIGLRSPHRMTRDPVTGKIYVGDIGQNTREEVSVIEKGGNYQWPYMEGTFPGAPQNPKPSPLIGTDKPPLYDYGRGNLDTCVIGGYVYRGTQMPELNGKYIFGDNTSGRIWALTENGSNEPPTITYLCNIPPGTDYTGLASFGLDPSGELYCLQMGQNGKVYRLGRTGPPTVFAPALLSQTGAFLNTTNLTPNPALIPYTVNSPLWSDGAEKIRWLAVPNNGAPYTGGEQISFVSTGSWVFPSGTVFVKHFELSTNTVNPSQRRRLETRLLVRDTNDVVYGLTYKWRADGSDADLLNDSTNENVIVFSPSGSRTQSWFYPSPQDCLTCHTPVAGHVLGVSTKQLNGHFHYSGSGVTDNQLRALNNVGLFTPTLNESAISNYLKMVAVTNEAAGFEARVRSYLDANCSQCHRPGGVQGHWDARFETPLTSQNIIGGAVFNTLGITNAQIVAPADLSRSILYRRMNTNGLSKMPPLARSIIDTDAVDAVAQWILSYAPAPLVYPWQSRDIGPVQIAGSASSVTNNGGFSVAGSGTDIWNNGDEFHFAYLPAGGDCEVIARVTSVSQTGPWAKAGVMIRESLAPGARNVCVPLTSENGTVFQWRSNTDGSCLYIQGPYVPAPWWVRLTRTNNTFRAYESANGTSWSQIGTALSLTMSSNTFIGLAVSAVNPGALNTAIFENVVARSKGFADSDSDGMPDSYEVANGLNPDVNDGNGDVDGDGLTNYQEFLAGTLPQDARSALRLTRITAHGSSVVLGWNSTTGKTYIVERTTNFAAPWQTVTSIAPATRTNTVVTNAANTERSFYRVRLVP